MKKSIKYAGIAAATLLTVAPIAAPVVSNVTSTTVQAAGNVDQGDINTATDKLANLFGNITTDDLTNKNGVYTGLSTLTLGSGNATGVADFLTKNKDIVKSTLDSTNADYDALIQQGAQLYVEATDNQGNKYDGAIGNTSDLQNVMGIDKNMPVSVTVYMKYKTLADGSYNNYTKLASFDITKSQNDELTSLNAKFTTPLNVALNSKTAATQLVNNSNVSVVDQNGDSIATSAINLGTNYYYTYAAAMDAAKATPRTDSYKTDKTSVLFDADGKASTDVVKNGEFKKAGTYYQTVTYTAAKGSALSSMIKDYQKDPSGYTILVNGKKAASGYDFNSIAESEDGSTLGTITFVRAINVATSDSDWTTENVDGQVTTKNDASYYTLKNNDNNTITNRALQANTAWKTDKVRTDQNGNKQYRVATGEWVNANDVTFTKAGDVDTSTGALTDIQKVTGTASLDGGNYVYFLYGKDGKVLTQRSLMPGTDWKVINTAKDAEGNTYYRVATNEWLQQGTGVHFN